MREQKAKSEQIRPTADEAKRFMRDLSVRKIPGVRPTLPLQRAQAHSLVQIGRVTERWLEALGVLTCHDIFLLRGKLLLAKGESGVTTMLKAYLGMAGNVVKKGEREDRRGVGHETTFSCVQLSRLHNSKSLTLDYCPTERYGDLTSSTQSSAKLPIVWQEI